MWESSSLLLHLPWSHTGSSGAQQIQLSIGIAEKHFWSPAAAQSRVWKDLRMQGRSCVPSASSGGCSGSADALVRAQTWGGTWGLYTDKCGERKAGLGAGQIPSQS